MHKDFECGKNMIDLLRSVLTQWLSTLCLQRDTERISNETYICQESKFEKSGVIKKKQTRKAVNILANGDIFTSVLR